jgi:hypothetical protein
MHSAPECGKLYRLFTLWAHLCPSRAGGRKRMVGLALAMFIALFAWGASYFGWSDPEGKVQLALFTTFILGVICGYKGKS